MPDNPLIQRDLDAINREFEEIRTTLGRIESKQDYTNGRVTALERSNIYVRGFMGALGLVVSIPALIGTVLGAYIIIRQVFG